MKIAHPFRIPNNFPSVDGRNFEILASGVSDPIPEVFKQDRAYKLPIFNQRNTPSCGAHATVWLKMLLDSYDTSSSKQTYSPRFNWAMIRRDDSLSPDEGSYLTTIMGVLRKIGALPLKKMPNDTNLSNAEYVYPDISNEMIEAANENIIRLYSIDTRPTFSQIKSLIYKNRGAILLVDIGDEWWTARDGKLSWKAKDILPLRNVNEITSRHYIVAHSYDAEHIYFANSFSDQWGEAGHGSFTDRYTQHVLQAATAVDVPNAEIAALLLKKSLLQRLVSLYKQLKALQFNL